MNGPGRKRGGWRAACRDPNKNRILSGNTDPNKTRIRVLLGNRFLLRRALRDTEKGVWAPMRPPNEIESSPGGPYEGPYR